MGKSREKPQTRIYFSRIQCNKENWRVAHCFRSIFSSDSLLCVAVDCVNQSNGKGLSTTASKLAFYFPNPNVSTFLAPCEGTCSLQCNYFTLLFNFQFLSNVFCKYFLSNVSEYLRCKIFLRGCLSIIFLSVRRTRQASQFYTAIDENNNTQKMVYRYGTKSKTERTYSQHI